MEITLILTLILSFLIIYYIIDYCKVIFNYNDRNFIQKINVLPGPLSLPFIGSGYIFLVKRPTEILDILNRLAQTYLSPFRFRTGDDVLIVIYDADQIQTVLKSSCFNKAKLYNTLEPLLGDGLVTSPTSKWTRQRKMAKSLFTPSNMQRFFHIFAKQFSIFTNKLGQLNENDIMLQERILKCTFATASETLMGVELESQTTNKAIDCFNSYRKYWNYVVLKNFGNLLSILIPFKIKGIMNKVLEIRKYVTNKIIEKNKSLLSELDTESHKEKKESYFWKLYEELKDEIDELDDNITTMLLAASDTTAVTMYFVLYMLANFPEIQDKVYKELLGIYGMTSPKSKPIEYEHLKDMQYLTRVIKETLRLFPAVPMIGRLLTQDLKIGECILPKGANIVMPIINVHRNEKYWPNALTFEPDRFLNENLNSVKYYLPFSNGRRNCIGQKYAMISMKVMLATLLRQFEFKIDKKIKINEIKLTVNVTLEPVTPIKFRIVKR